MYVGPPLRQEQLELLLSVRKGGNILELYLLPQEVKVLRVQGNAGYENLRSEGLRR